MKKLHLFFYCLLSIPCFSQNLADAGILRNTFSIQTDSGSLTAFVIIHNNQEYLITAKHGFKTGRANNSKVSLKILYDSTYKNVSGTYYIHQDSSIDIAVIKLSENIAKLTPTTTSNSFFIGEDCMFFGYPYSKFYTKAIIEFLPFVKKATISAAGQNVIFLDGINNPGFSGGPVLRYDSQNKRPVIIGVISGYYPEYDSVTDSKKNKSDSLRFYLNSGIIYSYRIDLIDKIIP